MSDLNDLIATNSINAFNQGVQTGVRQEQERIIKLLENHEWFEKGEKDEVIGMLDGTWECECAGCSALIKGENK